MSRFVFILGFGTLLIFGLGGVFFIEYFQDKEFVEILLAGWTLPGQLAAGAVAGGVSGAIALFIITRPFFHKERNYYYDIITSRLKLNTGTIVFISLCAGIGEEIFFRGGLQPLIGLWLTAVIFVGLHGYLSVSNWRLGIYGLVMLLIIGGFGYLFRYVGLISVILAHSIYDIILFVHMYRSQKKTIIKIKDNYNLEEDSSSVS